MRVLNRRNLAVYGMLLMVTTGQLSADECQDYLTARTQYDDAGEAMSVEDWGAWFQGTATAEVRAEYNALQVAEQAYDDAAIAVQYSLTEPIVLAIHQAADVASATRAAEEAILGLSGRLHVAWSEDDSSLEAYIAAKKLNEAAGKAVEAKYAAEKAWHGIILAACLQQRTP